MGALKVYRSRWPCPAVLQHAVPAATTRMPLRCAVVPTRCAIPGSPTAAAPEAAPPPKDNTGKKVAAAVLLTSGNR